MLVTVFLSCTECGEVILETHMDPLDVLEIPAHECDPDYE